MTHAHRYNSGDDYPEHCAVCGISILDDESYQASQLDHLRENIARVNDGKDPRWSIDRRAMDRAEETNAWLVDALGFWIVAIFVACIGIAALFAIRLMETSK